MRRANSTLSAPPDPQDQSCQLDLVALGDRLHLAALADQRGPLGLGNRSPRWRLADQPVLGRRSDRGSLENLWGRQAPPAPVVLGDLARREDLVAPLVPAALRVQLASAHTEHTALVSGADADSAV